MFSCIMFPPSDYISILLYDSKEKVTTILQLCYFTSHPTLNEASNIPPEGVRFPSVAFSELHIQSYTFL